MENEIQAVQSNAVATTDTVEFNPVQGYICTFDMTDDTEKAIAVKCYNDAEPLSQHVGEIIKLANVLTAPGVRKSRIAGVDDQQCQNTYLVDVEGRAYFSQSDGVARSINMLVSAFPELDYKNQGYIEVTCAEKQLSNGNTMKSITPVL